MSGQLEILPEDFGPAMAVVAHFDDLEYGAASAITRRTRSGTSVGYVVVTDGEAGIDGPHRAAERSTREWDMLGGCRGECLKQRSGPHRRRIATLRMSGRSTSSSTRSATRLADGCRTWL